MPECWIQLHWGVPQWSWTELPEPLTTQRSEELKERKSAPLLVVVIWHTIEINTLSRVKRNLKRTFQFLTPHKMDANAILARYGSGASTKRQRLNPRQAAQLGSGFGSTGGSNYAALGSALGLVAGTGNPVAGSIGGAVGSAVDAAGGLSGMWRNAKSFFGFGDYTLRSNSLVNGGGTVTGPVTITPQGNRAIRVQYREYIGDVFTHPTSAGAFHAVSYSLNPGLVGTCPWLAPVAQQYEQWTPNGIVFEFKSTSSDYVATQALGSVIMATEYDVLDNGFSNKQEMLNTAYSNEAKPSEHIVHGVECDPRDNPNSIFYVRSGAVPADGDIRDYDLGRFTIATQGGATANLNLGSLYIHYDITFRKEQLFNGVPLRGALNAYYTLNGMSNIAPLGASTPTMLGSSIPAGDVKFTLNVMSLPTYTVGAKWLVIYMAYGTSSTLITAPSGVTALAGCSSEAIWSGPALNDTGYRFVFMEKVLQTSPVATISFKTDMTMPAGTRTGSIYLIQLNNGF